MVLSTRESESDCISGNYFSKVWRTEMKRDPSRVREISKKLFEYSCEQWGPLIQQAKK